MYKRGLAIPCKDMINIEQINVLNNVSWFYNWSITNDSAIKNKEFVPMIYGKKHCCKRVFDAINNMYNDGTIKFVLCINEPDCKSQANLSVDELLDCWKQITTNLNPNIKLVSPALASINKYKTYFKQFMTCIKNNNLREPDFIGVHYYGSINSDYNSVVNEIYSMYNLPIWLTEFAPLHGTSNMEQKNIVDITKQIIRKIENNPYVFRYSLFGCSDNESEKLYKFALFERKTTHLTQMGEFYNSDC